ncbi:hypothetical protein PO909_008729 [Leuciscus waleckii]
MSGVFFLGRCVRAQESLRVCSVWYVQSLIRRVVNNVNIVVNNLILKYVEDDIVLSVNITSAECYTVDELWDRAFMDIISPELVLRKVINFSDCTVCLDKRNASGKIEFYQDPLLYKCSFRTRLHFTYDNINAKIPAVIKVHTMVESLKLSLTDQQLPMFIRLMELGVALYYGEMGVHREGEREESGSLRESVSDLMDSSEASLTGQYYQGEDEDQGWMSWAWSFVPAIVSAEDEEGESESGFYTESTEAGSARPLHKSPRDPVVSVGFYCTKASLTFKLTESCSESSYYSPQKLKSREVLSVEQEGITVEALMMGEPFFDCQVGVVGCRAVCLKGIMGVRDFEENMNRKEEDAVFFRCGDTLSAKGMTYLTNSLFDYRSPENNGVRAEFILDGNLHREMFTEQAGLQRYGAFYMDYLYTMENSSRVCVGLQECKDECVWGCRSVKMKCVVVLQCSCVWGCRSVKMKCVVLLFCMCVGLQECKDECVWGCRSVKMKCVVLFCMCVGQQECKDECVWGSRSVKMKCVALQLCVGLQECKDEECKDEVCCCSAVCVGLQECKDECVWGCRSVKMKCVVLLFCMCLGLQECKDEVCCCSAVCVGLQECKDEECKDEPLVQETSVKRIVVGPLDLQLHSSAVHRILKMIACTLDHEYQPYCKPQPDVVEEPVCVVPEQVSALEEFIPTRQTSVMLMRARVTVPAAEYNLLHLILPALLGHKVSTAQASVCQVPILRPLPALQLQFQRVTFEHSEPMQEQEVTRAASSLSQPSHTLLHHCYTHCCLKVFELQADLTVIDSGEFQPIIPIIPSFSTAVYGKQLCLPAYW